ncbi:MAG: DUF1684 domain-containing protein [Cytophagaceae bacterium]
MKAYYRSISKAVLSALIGIVVVMIVFSIFSPATNEHVLYVRHLEDFREEKDRYFKHDENSPIEDRENFAGLNYFSPNPDYKIMAKLNLIKDSTEISLARTDGKEEKFIRYAQASFYLNDSLHTVTIMKRTNNRVDTNLRFLPFYDKTNGITTYDNGRYLDLQFINDEEIEIDFNLAYNPYCVYNYRYSCPFPPRENYISSEVLAGEKKYNTYE